MHGQSKSGSDEFFDVEGLVDYLHISTKTAYQWRWRREGPPGVKVGKRVLYRRSAVDAWVNERQARQLAS